MKVIQIRYYVWSLILYLIGETGINVEDLEYCNVNGFKVSTILTPMGAIVFVDITEAPDRYLTGDEFEYACEELGIEYPKGYEEVYEKQQLMLASNPAYSFKEAILSKYR